MFDRIYCIHLPNAERRRLIESQIAAEFVHAKPPAPGFTMSNMRRNPRAEFGANLSHIAAIVKAIKDGAKRPLFIEDDIVFRAGYKERLAEELPDWDVLYLGGHPREKAEIVSEGLAKVGKFSCAEAYSIRGDRLADFHQFWCDRVGQPNAMFDFILGEFAAANRAFCFYPVLTDQALLVSHIKGEIDDKRALVERGWQANLSTK